jgi:hypothetical protein
MGEAMLGREEHGGRRTEAEVTAVAQETERRCLSSPVFSVAGAEEGDGRQAVVGPLQRYCCLTFGVNTGGGR